MADLFLNTASDLFIKVLNMSIAANWLVPAVLLLRFFFKRTSYKRILPVFWAFVGLRLILPFSIETVFSLIPSSQTISPDIMMDPSPAIDSGIPSFNNLVNPVITQIFTPEPIASANPLQIITPFLALLWTLGMTVMLVYMSVSYLRLNGKVRTAVLLRDNICQSENISSSFVLGMIHPRIYLPFNIAENAMPSVIAHEQTHIRRHDHWHKPIGFLLLTLHWFNPMIWIAYILFCRDLELACDEQVIKDMNTEQRTDYMQALLSCSLSHRSFSICPPAFGEISVKVRVKYIINYKRSSHRTIIAAVIVCLVLVICFLTNPVHEHITNPSVQEYVPGQGNIKGDVNKAGFEAISEDFAIGADKNGMAVFKDPQKAFDTFTELYADGIALIQSEFLLPPISENSYDSYKLYGWQVTTGTEEQRSQAAFVTSFLDIYENSYQ